MEKDFRDQRSEIAMFYNVENLYTPGFRIQQRSGEYVPGLPKWDEKRYRNKLFKLAAVFQLCKEEMGVMPFIIGLSEVQGEEPLQELLKMEPFDDGFGFLHYESMDERGVDVALLYDKSKVEIISSEPISFFFEINQDYPDSYDTTRDILFCKIRYQQEIINVFVFHLPSKRENDVNRPKRVYILNEIKKRISALISEEKEAVLLMGDFNENPDDDLLINLLDDDFGEQILANPFIEIFNNRIFSTFHYKDGLLFDQILFSGHFYSENFPLNYASAGVFRHPQIANWDKKFKGRPFRTYAGTRYIGGYSDHFPVLLKFEKTNH